MISTAQTQVFFLAVTRVLAILIHVPVLGGSMVPNMVRIGLGFLLAVILIPWEPLPVDMAAIPTINYAMAIGREIIIGTLAGFGAALIFGALQVAGEIMSVTSAFGSARMLNPAFKEQSSALNNMFTTIVMVMFLVIDGHHEFLIAMQQTFNIVPLNGVIPESSLQLLVANTAQLIGAGIHLALPIVAAMLLVEIAFGLLARVAPQIQVFFMAIPLKAGVALLGLAFLLNIMLPLVAELYGTLGRRTLLLLGG